jgi:hypothetical protein
LLRKGLPAPVVRWTSFNKELGYYQGELQHKTQYMKQFLNLQRAEKSYDYHRIDAVLNELVRECVSIAEGKQLSVLHITPSL